MKKVLIISCLNLNINSSVNMANIAYINGFINNGFETYVVMPKCNESEKDANLVIPETTYYEYEFKNSFERKMSSIVYTNKDTFGSKIKRRIRSFLGKIKTAIVKRNEDFFSYYNFFIKQVVQNVDDFSNLDYDLFVSISSPVASHRLAELLVATKKIRFKKWIQIWEDPWYADLYVEKKNRVFDEEHRLISLADKIVYVSPLTFLNQKKLFPDQEHKMDWAFLPCYTEIEYKDSKNKILTLGYFGEYKSIVRNIMPLYNAISKTDRYYLKVYGNSDLKLESKDNILIRGRAPLKVIDEEQSLCDILVNISNLQGGQIPGKIYQYAGTNKIVLFVLDGTDEEQELLLKVFSKYNRFVFCKNNAESIIDTLDNIEKLAKGLELKPVFDFNPNEIVRKIVE